MQYKLLTSLSLKDLTDVMCCVQNKSGYPLIFSHFYFNNFQVTTVKSKLNQNSIVMEFTRKKEQL